MEGWMISLGLAAMAFISSVGVLKYAMADLKSNQEELFRRMEKHGDAIVALNTKSELSMTAKDVDDKYVSKELFRQFEKHIDTKFEEIKDAVGAVEGGQREILGFIRNTAERRSFEGGR